MTIELVVQLALACVGTLLLGIGSRISSSLVELTESVKSLNIKMAVIVEKVETHEQRLSRLEDAR